MKTCFLIKKMTPIVRKKAASIESLAAKIKWDKQV